MTINSLDFKHGAKFSGTYRVRHPICKVSRNGSQYLSITLEDATGQIRAYSWSEKLLFSFKDLNCVNLSGSIRAFNNSWIVNVFNAEILQSEPEHPLALIPRSICPLPTLLEQLSKLVNSISHTALRRFVESVLADDEIAFRFISLPASRQHHHCISGGLLEHSLECVAMVSRFVEFPPAELELAIIGALFHDIGKTKTLKPVGKLTTTGFVCDHDSLTLEVLATHLHRLETICPDAALALRYLWTWRNGKKYQHTPLLTIAETIAAADRISCGLNVQDTAFSNQPDWRSFARFGEKNSFWRPKLELRSCGR
jgi:3'-5' exoribonuclease